jgi:hypothetical protein
MQHNPSIDETFDLHCWSIVLEENDSRRLDLTKFQCIEVIFFWVT